MGEPDKGSLQAELERAGWRVERRGGDDWWVHENWELESTWRPVGAKVFVTLLVDPQPETSDVGSVWAISVANSPPIDRVDAGRTAIRASPRWPQRMKEIVEAATFLRSVP